ncbi:hypothetical protein DICPUDRAFT_160378 [Dictyostelium purpureum]|uniref:Homeobox domain-containing protein n=1 Tax=Dictyostelium purpureum TaxID=5786 RepID=F1A685_DICPU|nr:uncharacterized protein DICPUDRAFT_160378 [Dictyostelium purpureum]EGC28295.1 hypothetical protein DICPUDRAFT_160378 [Dictyostelium purpureum]|eukprot:XP_003295179.1 hypothetical protein DICPUDRAFT_160378 [Dictyostelium purpureum]
MVKNNNKRSSDTTVTTDTTDAANATKDVIFRTVKAKYDVKPKKIFRKDRVILEYCFDKNPFPDTIEKEIIAYQLEITVSQVAEWYKDKRDNLKKSRNISVPKYNRSTNELNLFFHNFPFPTEENIAYFALIYGATKEKIRVWFVSKRYNKRKTHIFIKNGSIDKSSYDPYRHLGNFYNFYDDEYGVNTDTFSEDQYKPNRIKTFDHTVYSITNIPESKRINLFSQRTRRLQNAYSFQIFNENRD